MSDCSGETDVFLDRSNLSDYQVNDKSTTAGTASSFDLSIGARAALTEHLKLVHRHGLDYGANANANTNELSWASWQPQNVSFGAAVDFSGSDYFEDANRVLLLATPERIRTRTVETTVTMTRGAQHEDEELSFGIIDVSKISIDEHSITSAPSSSPRFRSSPIHASTSNFSTPWRSSNKRFPSPLKFMTQRVDAPFLSRSRNDLDPVAAQAASIVLSSGQVQSFFGGDQTPDPFPFTDLDVSQIDQQPEQPSFELCSTRELDQVLSVEDTGVSSSTFDKQPIHTPVPCLASFDDNGGDQTGETTTPTRDPLSRSMGLFKRSKIPEGDRRRYRTVVPARVYLDEDNGFFDELNQTLQDGAYEF